MINRRQALAALSLSSVALAAFQVFAAEGQPFSRAAFDAALKAGKPILIDVSATWCPTCQAQAPILSELVKSPRFAGLTFFSVDFDSQKDVLRALRVQSQSTLLVFKGGAEVGRSVGDTSKASIEALLSRAI